MCYDYHGHWDKQTGHVAPLYYIPGDTFDYFNAVRLISASRQEEIFKYFANDHNALSLPELHYALLDAKGRRQE